MDGSLLEGTGISIADPNYFVNSLWDDPDCSNMTTTLTPDADMLGTGNGLLARRLSGFSSLLDEDGLVDATLIGFPKFRNSSADNGEQPRWIAEVAEKESEALPAQFTKGVSLSSVRVDDSLKTAAAAPTTSVFPEKIPKQQKKPQAKPKKAAAGSATAAVCKARQASSSSGDCTGDDSAPASPPRQEASSSRRSAPSDRVVRRRAQKKAYSQQYRVQQKSYVGQLEDELNQTKTALQFLQNVHIQLQVQHAQLSQQNSKREETAGAPPGMVAELHELRATVEEMRKELQAQRELTGSREGMVRKMLALFGPVAAVTDSAPTIEEAVAAALAVQLAEPVMSTGSRVSDGDQSMKSNADCSAGSAASRRSSWGRQCRTFSRSKIVSMSVSSD
jgi:hypothetical protein